MVFIDKLVLPDLAENLAGPKAVAKQTKAYIILID